VSDARAGVKIVEKALEVGDGILRCDPAWVARSFLPAGFRLGLPEDEYDVGERGAICERWLCSTTNADNAVGPPDEGLSYINAGGGDTLTLKEGLEAAGPLILGEEYAKKTGNSLGRLAKIYDFGCRIPYHIHQMEADAAKLGRRSKEEAYYFPTGVDVGPHPETFFGVHPYIVREGKQDVLLPYLEDWDSDRILMHSRAYLLVPGEGFHLPSGVLHAPGTAVTIELQEDSDVFSMLQALVGGKIIPKDLLYKDVHPDDRAARGERAVLDQIDWDISGDPFFYENRHTPPVLVEETKQDGAAECWIYYNTIKFSGKRLVVQPGKTFTSTERGVYSILVENGKGTYGGLQIEGGNFGLDELVICHGRATAPLEVVNTGTEELAIIKFFGPGINVDVPMLPPYPG
jgi:hypothetical protein